MEKWKQSIIPLFINFQKAFHTFISAFLNKVESIGNQNYLVTPHSCLSVKVRQLIVIQLCLLHAIPVLLPCFTYLVVQTYFNLHPSEIPQSGLYSGTFYQKILF